MLYLGIDLHLRQITISLRNEGGEAALRFESYRHIGQSSARTCKSDIQQTRKMPIIVELD